MMRRRALAGLLGGLALFAGSCGRQPRLDRIVLVTVDTLRADHLGAYGYPRPTSPFLDRLASEGVVFQRAMAPMATTVPSHASLFTSAYPVDLAVLKNGHRLADAHTTLAERLAARGFATAAFLSVSAHFGPAGMTQGFQHVDIPAAAAARSGWQTVEAAVQWLGARPADERLFLWVHLYDPHAPYSPPPEYEQPFRAVPRGERRKLLQFLRQSHGLDLGFFASPAEAVRTMDAYDGEVRAADHALERLHGFLAAREQGPAALWIVTADHGEGLGNHHWLDHGKHIYNEQLRVPLIVHRPAALHPRRVEQVVELVDVVPTIFALLGGEEPDAATWRGTSLVPLLTGDGEFPDKLAFAQRRHFDPLDPAEARSRRQGNFEEGRTWAVQNARFKYLHRTAGPSELFDLAADPYETRNLAGQGRPEEQQLRRALLSRVTAYERAARRAAEQVSPEALEALRSLGYVQ